MSRKRRVFDIDLPDELEDETFPAGKDPDPAPSAPRRGPMATAISENAESLAERHALEAQIRAENDALAHEHVRLKKLGLIVDLIPLERIHSYKLSRDRMKGDDLELKELKTSIEEIGLSNPIQVEPRGDGDFELIQGMRRLTAFRELLESTGDTERYGSIPAGVMARGDTVEELYRKMVDENLVRKDISFAEMAMLAMKYAADPATSENDPDKAVAVVFRPASYQKRSYIRSFIKVMDRLQEMLKFPQHIPRALGLALAARMEEIEGIPRAIKAELEGLSNRSVQDELAVLRRFSGEDLPDPGAKTFPAGKGGAGKSARQAKTTFQLSRPEGAAKCTASTGRLEIRLARDFSAVDRRKLEAAVQQLLDQIS